MGKVTAEQRGAELRSIPQVDRLSGALPRDEAPVLRVAAARQVIARATAQILAGKQAPSFQELVEQASRLLESQERDRIRPLINATGVLLHTNLGRAPLSAGALEAVSRVSSGYSNLEFDLTQGRRGSRYSHSARMLTTLTGAEAALVVNNNAAAVLLALAGTSGAKQAIISRGELIEIGGEFRIPEIMACSGALMREVGTTNRTHLRDYAEAITPDTGAILKVHPSNYQVTGFTASVPGRELAELAHAHGIPLIHDIGSGLLTREPTGRNLPWLTGEPSVADAVQEGADVVTFSGDKLLGGPQAGILVGRAATVDRLRTSPLLRAFRTDKTTLAALDATLAAYLEGNLEQIPFWSMALTPERVVRARAEAVVQALPDSGGRVGVIAGFSTTGGGSAPTSRIPTALIRVRAEGGIQKLAEALLEHNPHIVARIEDRALVLDLRTVPEKDDQAVAAALGKCLAAVSPR